MAPKRKHAPWRKSVLIPFWVLQIFFSLVMIALLVLAIRVLYTWENGSLPPDGVDLDGAVRSTTSIVVLVWIGLAIVSLILTITEIVLLAKHNLKPLAFLVVNVIKTAIWTTLLVLDILSLSSSSRRTASFIGLAIESILVLTFWMPLIYGAVIYHRYRTSLKSYNPIDHSKNNPYDAAYPSHFNKFVSPIEGSEADTLPAAGARRLSYNHTRDTRFDVYRKTSSYSEVGSPDERISTGGGSPPSYRQSVIPEVYVQHHDDDRDVEAFEMEDNRRRGRF